MGGLEEGGLVRLSKIVRPHHCAIKKGQQQELESASAQVCMHYTHACALAHAQMEKDILRLIYHPQLMLLVGP